MELKAIGGASNFVWTSEKGATITPKSISDPKVVILSNVTESDKITLTADGANGCPTTQAEQVISYVRKPTISLSAVKPQYCKGETEELVASSTSGNMMSDQWSWSVNDQPTSVKTNTYQISNMDWNTTNKYKVTGTNASGCVSDPDSVTVIVAKEPNLELSVDKNVIC